MLHKMSSHDILKAVDNCDADAINTLIDTGCDINQVCVIKDIAGKINPNGYFNATPLQFAVFNNDHVMTANLLACGANPDPQTCIDTPTPLALAIMNSNPIIVALLIDDGAMVNTQQNMNWCSPLRYLVECTNHESGQLKKYTCTAHLSIARMLLYSGIDIFEPGEDGKMLTAGGNHSSPTMILLHATQSEVLKKLGSTKTVPESHEMSPTIRGLIQKNNHHVLSIQKNFIEHTLKR
jgi:hypothetical protein